ncbi:MAG: membrane protein insertion efficiency factor YidD [Rhodocyclaceae bacterium]|nr:membrane protein insertion efficiency factor YidD [Rhodocyclaceae bacterium]MBX3671106.1 membrane protein insertion efficiency factor YidD [Rhodocyclaceae bacterium]
MKRLCLALIRTYQQYISPYKGWHCAHAHVHGGLSCSNYGIKVISENGFMQGMILLRKRFNECATAAKGTSSINISLKKRIELRRKHRQAGFFIIDDCAAMILAGAAFEVITLPICVPLAMCCESDENSSNRD